MGNLSKNFNKEEFTCKCGCNQYKDIDPTLIYSLELLRHKAGLPIIISSGYRCKQHPLEIHKKTIGQHQLGKACDIRIPKGLTKKQLLIIILTIPQIKGIGLSVDSNYLHIDTRDKPTKWGYYNNKQITYKEALIKLGWIL